MTLGVVIGRQAGKTPYPVGNSAPSGDCHGQEEQFG